jgi:oxygen-dependent protoporphyrinogen oxidase
MSAPTQRVTILGAGISGLACAYRLGQLGISASVLEQSQHPGGLIDIVETEGFLFESGPQSFLGAEPLLTLVRELGLESELQIADPSAPRFIVKGRRLQKLPMSPQAMLRSSFLAPSSRLKLAAEPFRKSKPPESDETIASFVRRKFGNEILEYLVAPFVSGVYAGDPERLSLRAAFPQVDEWEREYGSVLRGAIKSRRKGETKASRAQLCSFRQGVATLPRAIAKTLGANLYTGLHVARVSSRQSQPAVFDLEIANSSGTGQNSSGAVVVATAAYTAADLVREISPALCTALCGIAYAPVAVVAAGYKREHILDPLYGFGFLVPRKEQIRTLGTIWNSSLFRGRGPDGTVTMTSFIGGATDLEIVQHSDQEIARIVHHDNAMLLGINGEALAAKIWKYPRALPQYNVGHQQTVESIRSAESALPGLFLAGNYFDGPSLAKCVENGFQTAARVAAYLQAAR